MAYSKIEKTAITIAGPIAENHGCYVYDAEYVKEGGATFLRVYVDKDGGITLDECEGISRELSDALDSSDPISSNYYLEVSSPGVERKLKTPEHFKMYEGETVDIGLYKAADGKKLITAKLIELDNDKNIVYEIGGEKKSLPQRQTSFVKLHFDF